MKKTALILLLTVATLSVKAQTIQDALRFSESNYEGTARTLAMGNAFTALGGDLGAVSINPAGSAVAGYGQITITPGINISTGTAGGATLAGQNSPYCFENRLTTSRTKFSVPNYGVTMNFDMHRNSGLKNITVGFIANATNRFQSSSTTSGQSHTTSLMGALASGANGFDVSALSSSDAYNNMFWSYVTAYQSGMINNITGYPYDYVGTSEIFNITEDPENSENVFIEKFVSGPLNQKYQKQENGYKYDYVFNIGFNISDFVYFGANLGITSLNYDSAWRFTEAAMDPMDFENKFTIENTENPDQPDEVSAYFTDMQYDYHYSASGAGVYGKFGIIVTPFKGLRLGAAVQTPASTNIRETWSESGTTRFDDSRFNASAESPVGEYEYRLISPLRANFGAAWTFGTFGLLSVDYELCDYSTMRFEEMGMDSGEFDYQNADIKDFMGTSHMFRAGVEIKPLPQFAIRAGYNLTTSPEKSFDDSGNLVYINKLQKGTLTHKGSFGIGYSSNGSFFIDAACSFTKYRNEHIYPYSIAYDGTTNAVTSYGDYIFTETGDIDIAGMAPEILNKKMLWNVLVTFGFRF